MNLLVYLGHPAHFHLFKNTIQRLQSKSVEVTVVIKSKDVLETLLIDSNIPYINISKKKINNTNSFSLYFNFFKRLIKLTRIIRKHKINLLVGSASELALIGEFLNIPSYIFFEDDLEAVKKFAKLTGPNATKLICPHCCGTWKWNFKKIGYRSYHELAYLHPNYFTPDRKKIEHLFNPNEKNFILRFAQLTAYHDVDKTGITTEIAQQLIDYLEKHGKVFISSERELEPQFEKYRIQISPLDIHHALYYADMYIGDSQTMTAEAAVLGTPAIRFNDFVGKLSYLRELERWHQLAFGVKTTKPEELLEKVKMVLNMPNYKEEWQARRAKMLEETIDLTEFMVELIFKKLKQR